MHTFEQTSYEIISLLGEGAMGTVYLARHRRLRRKVVIKVLKTHLGGGMKDRFRLEAQSSAQLQHDNIINVTDCGSTASHAYLVMELLEGSTLEEHVVASGGFLPVQRSCDIVRQVLSGLGYAHERGVIHRDVKPANIFLCQPVETGRAKLLDFGVAKLIDSLTGVVPLSNVTASGAVVGTPRYMSPEQARGTEVIDGRTDLYSVGLILYRLLTGTIAFSEHKTITDLLTARCRELPPAPSLVAKQAIPKRLDALVLRAIAIDPDARFQNAYEMIGALLELGSGYQRIAAQFGFDEMSWREDESAARAAAKSVPAPSRSYGAATSETMSPPAVVASTKRLGAAPAKRHGAALPDPTVLASPAELPGAEPVDHQPPRFPVRTFVDSLLLAFFVTVVIGFTVRALG